MIPTYTDTALRTAFPTVQLDAAMRIVFANDAAKKAGIQPGIRFPVPLLWDEKQFLLWHESRILSLEEAQSFPALGEPVRFRIADFHGFHMAYISYQYALTGTFAEVTLFHSHREYMQAAPYLSAQFAHCADNLKRHIEELEERCDAFLQNSRMPQQEISAALRELMAAALFIVRVFSPVFPQRKAERQRLRLSAVLNTYLSAVLPEIQEIDCRTTYAEAEDAHDLLLPLDPSSMFLLLTALFRLLSDLSLDGQVDVSLHKYGQDGEIRVSAVTHRAMPPLSNISDFSALSALFPSMEFLFILADYLAGIQDCYLDFFADSYSRAITISLFVPYEKTVSEFKSPLEEEAALAKAKRCLRGILFLEEAAQAQKEPLSE